jgi:hypothetical protein
MDYVSQVIADDPTIQSNIADTQAHMTSIGDSNSQIGTTMHDSGGSVILGSVFLLVEAVVGAAVTVGASRLGRKALSQH